LSFQVKKRWRMNRLQGDQMSLWKNGPKCSPTLFCQYYCITLTVEKGSQKVWATFAN
jgi:hypothetical protein